MALRSRSRRFESQPLVRGWMVNGTRVVASVNVASSPKDRRVGMKAFTDASFPLVIQPCNWVHSFGMKFPIDVVYLDGDGVVLEITPLRQNRLAFPRRRAVRVVETAPGATGRWGVAVGDVLTFRGAEIAIDSNWRPTE